MMQTTVVLRLLNGFFKLLLVLSALLAAQFLLVMSLIHLMRHDTRLRAKVFEISNLLTLFLAGRRFSPLLWQLQQPAPVAGLSAFERPRVTPVVL